MLLFNIFGVCRSFLIFVISKHPMLLFNNRPASLVKKLLGFQNILCYCLTVEEYAKSVGKSVFQTILCYCLTCLSYVCREAVLKFQNILCYCLTPASLFKPPKKVISKHPMLLFNFYHITHKTGLGNISKHPMLLFNCITIRHIEEIMHFKTSYVTV